MINTLHAWGVTFNLMDTTGIGSGGLAFAFRTASNRLETAGPDRADRWGDFDGEWGPRGHVARSAATR